MGLLFYATPLHPLIKWPFIVFFSLLGAALAFLPFEERPLEKWIVAFFRSVYSPTLFSWKKESAIKFYQEETTTSLTHNVIAPLGQEALNSYLANSQSPTSFFKKLEEGEKSFLNKMGDLFAPGSPQAGSVKLDGQPQPVVPNFAPAVNSGVASQAAPEIPTPTPSLLMPSMTVDSVEPAGGPKMPAIQPIESSGKQGPVVVPRTEAISVPKSDTRPKFVVEESTKSQPVEARETPLVNPAMPGLSEGAQKPTFSPDAAPPTPPTVPNTLTGQVMTAQNKIIQGAILEIRDVSGRPVRALRTNMLGHFLVVTPLVNGTYEIITEKDGVEFEPVKFEAEGKIIEPIAIRAKEAVVTPTVPANSTQFTSSQSLQA